MAPNVVDQAEASATMEVINEDVVVVEDTAKPSSNSCLRASMTEETRELSKVSQFYDIGSKGFLTPAEQTARNLDHKNEGNLSNEQVVGLVERTEDLKKANKKLRRYMIALLLVTVTLGISQIATAIVAARLSKDTSVNSSPGLMTVKDGGKPVVVVSTGTTTVINLNPTTQTACVKLEELGDMLAGAAQGTSTNAVFRTESSMTSVSFAASSSDETSACLVGTDGSKVCTNYEPCREDDLEDGGNRRTLEELENHKRLAHRFLHQHLERALYFDGLLGVDEKCEFDFRMVTIEWKGENKKEEVDDKEEVVDDKEEDKND